MKVAFYILGTLILSICIESGSRDPQIHSIVDKHFYSFNTPIDSAKPYTINRMEASDSIFVEFQSGGTQTDLILHKLSDYKAWKAGLIQEHPEILAYKEESVNEDAGELFGISLTNLSDDSYIAIWNSSGLSAFTVIELKTINKQSRY